MQIHGTETGRFVCLKSYMKEVERAPLTSHVWPLCANCKQSVTGKYGTTYGCARCQLTTNTHTSPFGGQEAP